MVRSKTPTFIIDIWHQKDVPTFAVRNGDSNGGPIFTERSIEMTKIEFELFGRLILVVSVVSP